MARFVQIGKAIINLDQVVRIERGEVSGGQTTVIVYFLGGDGERVQAYFTDDEAESVWQRFAGLAEQWDVPEPDQPPGSAAARPRSHP